ncbi:recombinase RecA [Candidatus Saccharibacteria bacterium]|nr:recombinase RecA [Candidatus Saccharibacteria bacterium]
MAKKAEQSGGGGAADGKGKALELAMEQITKQFGDGAIMQLGKSTKAAVELIPSGALSLDLALGGGYPKGRIIEIYGPESSGKTTLAMHAVAQVQKSGGAAAFIDAEHAFDPAYAKKIGVDTEKLVFSQPDSGEQALEICETLVRSGAVDIIVVDSVAALTPQAEIDGDMGDSNMGLHARLMSQAMRKLTSIISKTGTVAIFINQVREKIGGYGNPETTPGGRALKFYASVRIQVSKGSDKIMDGSEQIGVRTKCKVVKNKVAPPFKSCEFDMIYGIGISKVGEILDLAVELDICKKSGAWFYYGDMRLGQGRENAKKYLLENSGLMDEIEGKIRELSDKIELEEIAPNLPGDSDAAPLPAPPAAAAKSKKSKKSILIEGEEDFEEFSPEELG